MHTSNELEKITTTQPSTSHNCMQPWVTLQMVTAQSFQTYCALHADSLASLKTTDSQPQGQLYNKATIEPAAPFLACIL